MGLHPANVEATAIFNLQNMTKTLRAKVGHLLYPLAQLLTAHVVVFEATARGMSLPIRCMFIGDDWILAYIMDQFAVAGVYVPAARREPFWQILRRMSRLDDDGIDLCLAIPPGIIAGTLSRRADFRACQGVGQRIPLPGWQAVVGALSSTKRNQVNRLERSLDGLSYRISRRDEDLHRFYECMFKPLVTRRFGDNATIESLTAMRRIFRRGFLLMVEKDSQDIGGVLLCPEQKTLYLRRVGVLHGDQALTESGLQVAQYYFSLKYALENGFEMLDAMMSAPFLTDGVYRSKASWGAWPYPDESSPSMMNVHLGGRPDRLADFFRVFPLVVRLDEGLGVLAGMPADGGSQSDAALRLLKKMPVRGLKAAFLIDAATGIGPPRFL